MTELFVGTTETARLDRALRWTFAAASFVAFVVPLFEMPQSRAGGATSPTRSRVSRPLISAQS